MNIDQAIEILTEHNHWRRGEPPYDDIPTADMLLKPKEIGEAIDFAVEELHKIKTKAEINTAEDLFESVKRGLIQAKNGEGKMHRPEPTEAEIERVARAMMDEVFDGEPVAKESGLDWTGNDVWGCDFGEMAKAAIKAYR